MILTDLHSFPPYESILETTKSASAKRHPGEHSDLKKCHKLSSQILVIVSQLFKNLILRCWSRFLLKLEQI